MSARAPAQEANPCATAPASCATEISTQASSHTRIPNTVVDVTVGVQATGKDMSEVQRQISESSDRLIRYLKAQGAQRLMTEGFSFNPETQPQKNGPEKTVGYRGNVQVSFRTTPAKAPDVLGGVLQNGANTVDDTTFLPTEEETAAAKRSMEAEATKTALAEAEAIAKAASLRVVSVRNIRVQNQGFTPAARPVMRMQMEMKAAAPAPIATEAGDQEISASVDVVVAAK